MSVEIILGSAVIAAIISGIVAYATSKKQTDLQYITGERKEWREEIRKLAAGLNGASYKKTLQILAELKVRINAFGNNGIKGYDKDIHIWELINKIEEKKLPKAILEQKQKQLIEYLSLLLKDDWERTKKEVKGDALKIVSSILIEGAILFYILGTFILHMSDENSRVYLIINAILFNLLSICFNIAINRGSEFIFELILNDKVERGKEWRVYICQGICMVTALTNICYYGILGKSLLNLVSYDIKDAIIIASSVIIYMIGVLCQEYVQMIKIDKRFSYISSINSVKKKYNELENVVAKTDSDNQENVITDK